MSGKEYKAFLEGEHKVFEIGNRHGGFWQRITYNKCSFCFYLLKGQLQNSSYSFRCSYNKKGYSFIYCLAEAEGELFVSKNDYEACLKRPFENIEYVCWNT